MWFMDLSGILKVSSEPMHVVYAFVRNTKSFIETHARSLWLCQEYWKFHRNPRLWFMDLSGTLKVSSKPMHVVYGSGRNTESFIETHACGLLICQEYWKFHRNPRLWFMDLSGTLKVSSKPMHVVYGSGRNTESFIETHACGLLICQEYWKFHRNPCGFTVKPPPPPRISFILSYVQVNVQTLLEFNEAAEEYYVSIDDSYRL